MDIKTRFLILSDTHAEKGLTAPNLPVDVAIHCGDFTNESKLHEFRTTLDLLRTINAPLKIVIAGNHDFTLDTPMFAKKRAQAEAEYGDFGDARQLFEDARSDGVVFLDQGAHRFNLDNGARLAVYASPFTPSADADWGFQFKRGEHHDFAIDNDVDIVITHGPPPKGFLDLTASNQRGGCQHLFAAVAKARLRLHCFGHIYEGWGAKLMAWHDTPSEFSSHFSDINHGESALVDTLAALRPRKWDTAQDIAEKESRLTALRAAGYRATDHCSGSEFPVVPGRTTLFANAAIESTEEDQAQLPWVIDLELPAAIHSGCE
ncbi:ser/Thr protein phosphatase family protein [Lasiosphaeria miniovina]|uniref:Ser/Thr protein phosphatase family protein n=1 Tax=Lasiosphaeria miniovina TaxID=1954250 RepID=A0AA40A0N0_9PEZI|nr:ser/Thr protein phosphatase family protein [Lasiosphaeria miniovina]KAK0707108.1 ser/Thr protein phosphatase family protein [Lasiosphaeria miniovina]